MFTQLMDRTRYAIAAVGTLIIAACAFAGVPHTDYLFVRLGIGALWTAATVGWVCCYLRAARLERRA